MRTGLWVRWSLRDLRARWVQVGVIALIVALGSGVYAGLSSTSAWRRRSNDESYARLHMHDLRVTLAQGNYVSASALRDAVVGIPDHDLVRAAVPRLIAPTPVDASSRDHTILVPGRLVGVDLAAGPPPVDGITATAGRSLRAADTAKPVGVLDVHFARRHGLPVRGRLVVANGRRIDYVGLGLSPEYFVVTNEQGNVLAAANLAVVFVPLDTAQALLGHPGAANDLVLTLRPGASSADRARVRTEIDHALAVRFPEVGVTIGTRRDERSYRLMYDDIGGDQRFYDIFALLILFGAAFAAFNLTGRIVESQRREIGIGMAIGAPPRELAIRPLLVGGEVALLGVLLGAGVGALVGTAMISALRNLLPLPVWRHPFQLGPFVRGAAAGFVLPIVATAYPVWRAVRVAPFDAIRTGSAATRGAGLAPIAARVPLPGPSTAQMPVRNVLRAPRRTLMTVLGIGAAIVVLIAVVGMIDSFLATMGHADTEILKTSPRRLVVDLDYFYPGTSPTVTAITGSPLVVRAEPRLSLGGDLRGRRTHIPVLLELTDFASPMWHPTVRDARPGSGPAIVLSAKAAHDLGARPGDTVALHHPRRVGLAAYSFVDTPVRVLGLSPLPTRSIAFMDLRDADIMRLDGIVNTISVEPARGVSAARLERALFAQPGVASVQPVSEFTETMRKELGRSLNILTVVEAAVLLLALLIAFNSASINADERAREHATMFAFGLRVRSVVELAMVESLIVGVLGTAVGVGTGWLLLGWLVHHLIPQTVPEFGIVTALAPTTLFAAIGLGVGAVALAPLLTARKLRRMDIPSALRVME